MSDTFEIPNGPWELVTAKGFWYHELYGMPSSKPRSLVEGYEVIFIKETDNYVVFMCRPSEGWCYTCEKAVWHHHTMSRREYDRNFLNGLYIPE